MQNVVLVEYVLWTHGVEDRKLAGRAHQLTVDDLQVLDVVQCPPAERVGQVFRFFGVLFLVVVLGRLGRVW